MSAERSVIFIPKCRAERSDGKATEAGCAFLRIPYKMPRFVQGRRQQIWPRGLIFTQAQSRDMDIIKETRSL